MRRTQAVYGSLPAPYITHCLQWKPGKSTCNSADDGRDSNVYGIAALFVEVNCLAASSAAQNDRTPWKISRAGDLLVSQRRQYEHANEENCIWRWFQITLFFGRFPLRVFSVTGFMLRVVAKRETVRPIILSTAHCYNVNMYVALYARNWMMIMMMIMTILCTRSRALRLVTINLVAVLLIEREPASNVDLYSASSWEPHLYALRC